MSTAIVYLHWWLSQACDAIIPGPGNSINQPSSRDMGTCSHLRNVGATQNMSEYTEHRSGWTSKISSMNRVSYTFNRNDIKQLGVSKPVRTLVDSGQHLLAMCMFASSEYRIPGYSGRYQRWHRKRRKGKRHTNIIRRTLPRIKNLWVNIMIEM